MEYVVIDYCWNYPHPPKSIQENPAQFKLTADVAPVQTKQNSFLLNRNSHSKITAI
jgi:hypothetical protein